MSGGGQYNRHAKVQSTAQSFALPLLERAAESAALPESPRPIVIADYGASTGANSTVPMKAAVQILRRRAGPARPIHVVHNDQAANDFRALFLLLESTPDGYRIDDDVFSYAAGRSFFTRVFSREHVSLGWCAIAAHWLSRVPAAVPGHVWLKRGASGPEARFAEQARADWSTFLEHRAAELLPGGQLVVVFATADEEGRCGADDCLDGLNDALKAAVRAGDVSEAEVERMILPLYFRTRAEIAAPFERGPVADQLTLIEHAREVSPDPLWAAYEATGDAGAYARAFTGWLRSFSESTVTSALDAGRPERERQALLDALYARVQGEVERAPERARSRWNMAALRIGRR
jgi:hypothetical protein